jgi:malonyl-CoA O-methyltransferase
MFDKRAIQADFSNAAATYDDNATLQAQVRQKACGLASALWPAGAQILDVGSGTGAFVKDAVPYAWQVTCADAALGMCQTTQASVPTINASADALPFTEGAFNGVFSNLMLQWCDEPQTVLSQMHRVLRAGGSAVVSTFTHGTLHEMAQAFSAIDGFTHVSDFQTIESLQQFARDAGFVQVELIPQLIVQRYVSLWELMHHLKAIGAVNKHSQRRQGLLTPRQLKRVEQAYTRDASGAFPASWQVLYMVLHKG